ncbi:hypothetical protein GRI58_12875 [Porphyrobacter algicida]|uniref:Uncharacterized protein n=1 Tax=Qipengyuania algicida TaxID=1836209 RepID=A0A845AGI1_9SPHN|nr:hypothetical protein [Qipengyuania algicida]MXP29702.1 hypothetical protein [Qipengyuania algicida]
MFFYQNLYGSRVFFDELGPPWPKHPCTDNSAPKGSGRKIGRQPAYVGQIRKSGDWIALRFVGFKSEDDWTVLSFEVIETDEYVRVLAHERVSIPRDFPAYMLPWDRKDYTEIEFLDRGLSPHRLWGWKYGSYFAQTAAGCLRRRRAQEAQRQRTAK